MAKLTILDILKANNAIEHQDKIFQWPFSVYKSWLIINEADYFRKYLSKLCREYFKARETIEKTHIFVTLFHR